MGVTRIDKIKNEYRLEGVLGMNVVDLGIKEGQRKIDGFYKNYMSEKEVNLEMTAVRNIFT